MQHSMSSNYFIYYFLPILACAYVTLYQYSFFDFNLGFFLTTNTTTTPGAGAGAGADVTMGGDNGADAGDATSVTTTHPLGPPQNVHYVTGSFANCRSSGSRNLSTSESSHYTISLSNNKEDAKLSFQEFIGSVLVSCQTISFRAPAASFLSSSQKGIDDNMGNVGNSNSTSDYLNHPQIITGVLSSAIGDASKQRRQSIRKTWAQRSNTRSNTERKATSIGTPSVYFLLAGPWENIKEEYYTHQDIIWIDQEEVYNGEKSVLTLKTYSFFQIIHAILQEYHVDVTHLFKTDDDSYVNLHALHEELKQSRHDYFGQCQFKYPQVHRESEYKWPIRNETYPEPWFPRYCQGAGFGISLRFLKCSAGRGHVSNIRFMPFEDVAVGMLAERCGVDPERPVTAKVRVFRYQSDEVKKRTRLGDTRTDDLVAPAACMMNKIVQHRIIDEYDMEEHHRTVLDPSYCNVTKVKRDQRIQQLNDRGIEWFG
mmetsp:Transcript_16630/g.31497  ORF Transcript_16630/g.31497 Transcript_16630/m.31497 type:complete len:483 (+) Transcript_16630:279-1727(+)